MNIEAKYRNNGYTRAALRYFREVNREVMVDDVALNNKWAQEVLLKFGFQHDPTLAKQLTSVGGEDAFWVRMDKWMFEQLSDRSGA